VNAKRAEKKSQEAEIEIQQAANVKPTGSY
jgi:hypothetical protein